MQMGARVYIPGLGRFLQVDPVEGGTPNNYVYTLDPVNGNDYSGQAFFIPLLLIAIRAAPVVIRVVAAVYAAAKAIGPKIASTINAVAQVVSSIGGAIANGVKAAAGAASKGAGSASSTGRSAANTVVNNTPQLKGYQGMQAANQAQNTQSIPSLTGTANFRIPDGLTTSRLTEVKNVANQSYTRQLQDFNLFAQRTGRQFDLKIRAGAHLSEPLKNQAEKGLINIVEITMQ